MTFGEKLQSLRRRSGMSQDTLAERLEVSRQAVSKWERDETMPETEKVVRIAKLFDVSLDELLLGKEPEPKPEPRYQPYTPPLSSQPDRFESFLRRHGYKFGYVMMAVGAFICIAAILMRLIWPSLAGNFLGAAIPDPLGMGEYEFVFEGDLSVAEQQAIMDAVMGSSSFGGIYNSMTSSINSAVKAQANLFLIALIPGLALIGGGLFIVIKGKKLSQLNT